MYLNIIHLPWRVLFSQVVQPGQPAWKLVVQKFGEDILLPNGEIDREKLGQIIFSDPRKRKILNNCTHPEIHKVMFWKILKLFLQGKDNVHLIFGLHSLYPCFIFVLFCFSVWFSFGGGFTQHSLFLPIKISPNFNINKQFLRKGFENKNWRYIYTSFRCHPDIIFKWIKIIYWA